MLILCIPNVNENISNLYYHSEKTLLNNINFYVYFGLESFPRNINTLYISIVNTINGNISNVESGEYFILSNETRLKSREKRRR